MAAQSTRKPLHLDVSIRHHRNIFLYFFRFRGFGVCLLCSLSRKGICIRACLGRLLILLQYELSGCICLCYSGTQNSILSSRLILHNGRLLAGSRLWLTASTIAAHILHQKWNLHRPGGLAAEPQRPAHPGTQLKYSRYASVLSPVITDRSPNVNCKENMQKISVTEVNSTPFFLRLM